MNRRGFLLGGAVLALPGAVRAQPRKPARIGMLAMTDPGPYERSLREALAELGYVEGKSVIFEMRSAKGDVQALDAFAAELIRSKVDLIVAYQTPAVAAAKRATATIPIVMVAGDAVGTGLVASLSRPGGNISGVSALTAELAAKNLEVIRQVRPQASRVGVLANPVDAFAKSFVSQLQDAAKVLGIELLVAMVRTPAEYEAVFADWARAKVDAVMVQPSLRRPLAAELAVRHRLPAMAPAVLFVEEGGLAAYANSPRHIARKSAGFVDRILRGANPATMPVEQPDVFELTVNLKTAKALGITLPQALIARADTVIQ